MTSEAVAALLDRIGTQNPTFHAMAESLRALVHMNAPEAEEQVKYGGIFYSRSKPVCGIYAYRGHVSLEFSRGAEFDDGGLLGDGDYRRHLKFTRPEEIEATRVGRYIAEAYSRA